MKKELTPQKKTVDQSAGLTNNSNTLTDGEITAVKEFVEQLGGIENARRAIAALKELKKAA